MDSAMRVSNGVVVTDVEGFCESWACFYQYLFTTCPVDLGVQTVSLYLFLLMMALLVTVQSRLMRLMLLSLACLRASLQALMVCQWNFMLLSWICLVGILLMFSILLWRLASCLSLSMRRSLPLIFKKGDHLDHKNCRPISPLNVDYKLCARVLAGRLLKVIATVVSPDQTCGVPGRCIGENGAFLRDVAERANKYNPPVAPLFWIRRSLSTVLTGLSFSPP